MEEVGAPHLKLQLDLYHLQVTEGDITKRTEKLFPITAHVQIAGNPDRNEPDLGEANHLYVLDVLDRLGYQGYVPRIQAEDDDRCRPRLGRQVRHQGLIDDRQEHTRRRLRRPGLDGAGHGEEPAEARPQGDRRGSQRDRARSLHGRWRHDRRQSGRSGGNCRCRCR